MRSKPRARRRSRADLDRIAAIESVNDLGGYLGSIHSRAATGSMLFGTGVEQDAKDSSIQIMALYAGGLGLPDRDYYLKDDAKSKELRAQYVRHIENMLILLGDTPQAAREGAAAVMRMETALAKASLNVVDRRDPYKVYHRTLRQACARSSPASTGTTTSRRWAASPANGSTSPSRRRSNRSRRCSRPSPWPTSRPIFAGRSSATGPTTFRRRSSTKTSLFIAPRCWA